MSAETTGPTALPALRGTDLQLGEVHDLAMLDLDGVVYVGPDAVPGAPAHLAAARKAGMRLAFVTNNASRPPQSVAGHLTDLGVPADAADVVTSAQAAARVLADRLGAGARVAMLGAAGLEQALVAMDLVPVGVDAQDAAAVVTGYGPEVVWQDLMRAAVRIRDGLWWVATNTDMTIPTPYGVAPGHGVQVEMLRRFTEVDPTVAGKPARPLLDETVRRVGGQRPVMVGDRLDTDIEGAAVAEVASLLVLTGVTGLAELLTAPASQRPTYLSCDLAGLLEAHPEVVAQVSAAGCSAQAGGWTARVAEGDLVVGGGGGRDDWWRCVAVAAWAHLDHTGAPARADRLGPAPE